ADASTSHRTLGHGHVRAAAALAARSLCRRRGIAGHPGDHLSADDHGERRSDRDSCTIGEFMTPAGDIVIRPATSDDALTLAALHGALLPGSRLSLFGPGYLASCYRYFIGS